MPTHGDGVAAEPDGHGVAAGRVVVACVEGDPDEALARRVSEELRGRGWLVDLFGPRFAVHRLVTHLHREEPRAVVLTSSDATLLPSAHITLTACQALGCAVVAVGPAFGSDGRHARALGADAWSPDPTTTADLLADDLPDPQVRRTVAALPHLEDQEFALLSRNTVNLVAKTASRLPPDVDVTGTVTALTTHLVAALYLDDHTVLTDHLHSPTTASVIHLLDLRTQVTDFPRAVRILTAAIDHVRDLSEHDEASA